LFYIECKRPLKDKTIKKNLDKAYSQLRRRYMTSANPESTRGFVVLSIAKVKNPKNKTLGLWTLPHFVDREKSQYLLERKENWHGRRQEAKDV